MNWQEICDNPSFRDLPFKLETNRRGQIIMSPASNQHGLYQARIVRWLSKLLDHGEPLVECSVQTGDGVKVSDVAWGSAAFFARHRRANPYPQAPEIMVEILSPSNTEDEMQEKCALYFERGAQECWLCDRTGGLRFFDPQGELSISRFAPRFPRSIETDFS